MISIDWTLIRKSAKLDMEDDLTNCYAVIEALEKEKRILATMLDNLRIEATTQNQELLTAQNLAAQVPILEDQIAELDKEVLQLQKTSFAELQKPQKPKGGRPKKPTTVL